jgi:hypothetical protein
LQGRRGFFYYIMSSTSWLLVVLLALAVASPSTTSGAAAFSGAHSRPTAARRTSTELAFGLPGFLTPKESSDDKDSSSKGKMKGVEKDKGKIGLSGIVQLITAGAGAPFLGEFQGVEKETGKFMFSLEANNLVDENGNSKQTQMPYFESGWVDPEDERRAKEGFKFPWQK